MKTKTTTSERDAIAEGDRLAELAAQQPSATEVLEPSKYDEVNIVRGLTEKVDALPDHKDGLDLRQYKRAAKVAGQNYQNVLTAVLKLSE